MTAGFEVSSIILSNTIYYRASLPGSFSNGLYTFFRCAHDLQLQDVRVQY